MKQQNLIQTMNGNKKAQSFKDFPINMLLAGLFLICLITFAVMIARNYGETETLMKSEQIDFTRLESQVAQTSTNSTSWSKVFKSDSLFVVAGGIVIYSIWSVTILAWDSTTAIFQIYTDGLSSVLGVPSIVINVLTAIILISLIFAGWKLVKQGS